MKAPPLEVTTHYNESVVLVLCAIIVEVCAESPYILAELHMWPKVKVSYTPINCECNAQAIEMSSKAVYSVLIYIILDK